LGKPAFNDVKEGIITCPLIYSLLDLRSSHRKEDYSELNQILIEAADKK